MSPTVSSRTLRRVGLLLATPALAVSGLATTVSPAGADPAPGSAVGHATGPVTAGADWLTGQLDGGLLSYPTDFGPYTDHGLSIDAGLALAAVGGREATVSEISDGLAAQLEGYITGEAFGDAGSTYAGPAAKALVMAQTAGDDPSTYGGVDLVSRVESVVATTPPITGRIQDVSQYGDYANVLGQSYAAQGLAAAGSPRAADATAYLLQQQCEEGFFRLYFTEDKDAVDQSCDGGDEEASAADTDATAIAVLALEAQSGDPLVGAAIDRAVQWLLDTQRGNGSFGGGPATEKPNTNSTGVAAWALGVNDDVEAAERAAGWIRGQQAANVASCDWWAPDDTGAVAYDPAAKKAGQKSGLTDQVIGQWLRASAQAVPALQWAPELGEERNLLASPDYVRAGKKTSVGVIGADPGETLCATRGDAAYGGTAGASGQDSIRVRLAKSQGPQAITAHDESGEIDSVEVFALGKLEVPFRIKNKVPVGKKQVVRVSGLEAGELVRVKFRGKPVRRGQADADGDYVTRFKVKRPVGKAKLVVVGQFKNRKAAQTFRVAR